MSIVHLYKSRPMPGTSRPHSSIWDTYTANGPTKPRSANLSTKDRSADATEAFLLAQAIMDGSLPRLQRQMTWFKDDAGRLADVCKILNHEFKGSGVAVLFTRVVRPTNTTGATDVGVLSLKLAESGKILSVATDSKMGARIFSADKRASSYQMVDDEPAQLLGAISRQLKNAACNACAAPPGARSWLAPAEMNKMNPPRPVCPRKEAALEFLKQHFVEAVSHDLRAPLTALQITLDIFGNGSFGQLNETGMRRLEHASSDCQRLILMVDQLLDFMCMEKGKITLSRQRTNIASLINQSVKAVRSLADQRSIRIEMRLCQKIISVDRCRIIEVIVNLLDNAIKFSPPSSQICIEARDQGQWIEVRVRDQGRGIPGRLNDKAFDCLEQLRVDDDGDDDDDDDDDGPFRRGRGVGLTVSKAIIEAHGGTLRADSKAGEGSTLRFRLPA